MKSYAVFLIFVLLAFPVNGESYYADVSVEVEESGVSSISGISNHPLLQERATDSLTSKKGGHWLFNLTLPEEDLFSDFVYTVDLPDGAEINYVKTTGRFRITSSEGRISVSGTGSDMDMSVLIQYRLAAREETNSWYLLPVAFFTVLAVALIYLKSRRKPASEEAKPEEPFLDVLTERQKAILQIITESDKPVNQSLICERLSLPKSSVSRNVNSLAGLGLIEKRRVGVSTFLSLKRS
ncbi:MAG: MarR family transcriptional regulator [Candidatus Altiarchaeota archaeon]|nr:MarR family transcriptional regulator [Candidatus Altiarchaeota archaeon]